MSRTWGGLLAAASLLLLTACGAEEKPTFDELPLLTAPPVETPSAEPSATATIDPSASPDTTTTASSSPSPSVEPTGTLPDGRHPAYITGIDLSATTITVDVVQFFTGTAATQAATEDRAPEIPPPNGIWIRNAHSLLRTLPVAGSAPITVNTLAAEETGNSRKNLEVNLQKLASYPSLEGRLFYVTVSGGTIVVVAEQYLP